MTPKRSAAKLEKADRRASNLLNIKRTSWPIRLLGAASEIGDQPQMRLLCAATIAWGIARRDAHLAKTGMKMLAAHTIATWGKGRVKAVIDRTRPEGQNHGYKFGRGDSHAHEDNSFPSGHSAGAVAVAQAVGRSYPEHALASLAAAGLVAAVQVPRGKHFIGDVIAGSLIGIAAELLVERAAKKIGRAQTRTR